VGRAQEEGLRLYLCLSAGYGENSFPSPIQNEGQQDAYIEHAVKPITQRLKGNSAIFAFDIINEIESEVFATGRHKVTHEQAQAFIRRCARTIKSEDPKRLVSSGSGFTGWKAVQEGHYKGLGLDFYDIHVYTDDGYLPHVRELNVDKPVIIGECGQKTRKDDDALQQRVVPAILRNALEKGYAGCFIWEYGPAGRYWKIVRDDGTHKPVVDDIQRIIGSYKSENRGENARAAPKTSPSAGTSRVRQQGGQSGGPAASLKSRLAGTKWTNSNNVSFEWTKDGRFLHNGVQREWRPLDANRAQIVFGPGHVDMLQFDESLSKFKQMRDGSVLFEGRRQ
jgi:hypothetical protein